MKNYKILSIALVALISIVAACDSGENKETEAGVRYILISSEDGEQLEQGDFAIFSLRLLNSEDSVILDSKEIGELPVQIDDSVLSRRGPLFSILKELKVGDSIKTKLTATQIMTEGFQRPVSPDMEGSEKLTVFAKALNKFDTAGFMEWQQQKRAEAISKMQKEAEKQKGIDDEIIQEYLTENSLEAQKTESGIYYIITKEGTGEKPNKGDTVTVNYTGKLLNGTIFDSSKESVAKNANVFIERRDYRPYQIPIGEGQVIRGWDEGIMLLNEGAEATLIIPSPLGYGPRAAGENLPANSILVFDVELLDVK
ncbi:FKBP-type peptidyl-prolyl cis-trans isomerase [Marivirga sp.]|uniref:FKBP-type peptidyl-prolyl cis-trans isomerase n=1 Tax=Marivirga sp. TaxID=2018662 RepID=UPI002D800AE8|nr:FKBP-type peptidyl-prolyl cis-trans isomerase [Marivirga sp.]HET8861385.1 FKBP-type peptidyl-prolyl cis-trans isomerase [Marivirga sp.]